MAKNCLKSEGGVGGGGLGLAFGPLSLRGTLNPISPLLPASQSAGAGN